MTKFCQHPSCFLGIIFSKQFLCSYQKINYMEVLLEGHGCVLRCLGIRANFGIGGCVGFFIELYETFRYTIAICKLDEFFI